MHRNFSFPLHHCYSAMDVLQMQMQHCNKYQNNQDLSLPSGSDILPIIDPAERVQYMTCPLTSDISRKEFQHSEQAFVPILDTKMVNIVVHKVYKTFEI